MRLEREFAVADLDRAQMPTIEQAREFMLDLPRDRVDKLTRQLAEVQKQLAAEQEYTRRDPVRDEIQWQDALDKAAIAKENRERQFVEPKDREKEETRAGREQTQPGSREEKVWPIHPPQHQSWPGFERAATEATRDDRVENLKGPAAHVWTAWQQSDSAQAFAAALDDKGITFAAATGEEAQRSHREAEFAKAIGNRAQRFKEREIVIVTEQRPEYRRNGGIVEPLRVHKIDQSLATKFVKGFDNGSPLPGIDDALKVSDKRAQHRAADREAIRLENATNIKDFSRTVAKNIKAPAAALGKTAIGVGGVLHSVADAFGSLFAPTLTPQEAQKADNARHRREAEAEDSIDYSRYTAEAARQRQQQENEREAERQRQRDGGGRDR